MDKKPGLLFIVSMSAMILLAASFGMGFGGNPPVSLPSSVNPDDVMYVCPVVANSSWTQLATALHMIGKYAYLLFSFIIMVLLFSWGWALYQNLLKDKFSADVYKNPWDLTKVIFWAIVIFFVLFKTPNYFRTVEVRGRGTNWVLCENTSTGAKAIRPKNVGLSEK